MRRRHFLSTTGLAVGLSGFGRQPVGDSAADGDGDSDWSPRIHGSDLTVAPGDEATLSIEATDVARLAGTNFPDRDVATFDFDYHSVEPLPDDLDYSYPPDWYWQGRTAVSVKIPMRVSMTAPAGDYEYGIRAWDGPGEDSTSVTERFQIQIVKS